MEGSDVGIELVVSSSRSDNGDSDDSVGNNRINIEASFNER